MHTSLRLRPARLSFLGARLCGLSLLGLTLVGTACGDGNGSTTPVAGTPMTQREPSTPTPPAAMPMGDESAPPANPPSSPASSPPVAAGTGGSGATGNELPTGPVGLAGGTGQGPSGTSGGAPDAGAQPGPMPTPPPPTPAAFSPCPSDGTPCRIMPLGDSITFGVGSTGGGYRVELFRQAVADQHEITFVGVVGPGGGSNTPNGPNMVGDRAFPRSHEGFSGFSISGGAAGSLAGLVDAAIAQTNPNIVLLMIGTNDVNGNIDLANAPNRLGALLDKIIADAPNALLAVAQIIPITRPGADDARVPPYNQAITGLVQSRATAGKHVILVDMFTPFNTTPNFDTVLMDDNLHPNDPGYVVMAQTWYDAIESLLP